MTAGRIEFYEGDRVEIVSDDRLATLDMVGERGDIEWVSLEGNHVVVKLDFGDRALTFRKSNVIHLDAVSRLGELA